VHLKDTKAYHNRIW